MERATGIEPAHRDGVPNGFEDHCATVTLRPRNVSIFAPNKKKYTIMSKGIASRNSLKALAHPLQIFIGGWGAGQRVSASQHSAGLPAPYALAALRGEAVLRQRFFGQFLKKLPVELTADQQVALWHELVEDGGHITAWVQRLGIAKALRREAVLSADSTQESRALYCLLLDTLNAQATELLAAAVEGYFWHIWRAQFPETLSPTPAHSTNAEVLRERLLRTLRKHHREAVTIRESFHEADNQVRFSILMKRPSIGQWEEIIQVERPRLKTARLVAYAGYEIPE